MPQQPLEMTRARAAQPRQAVRVAICGEVNAGKSTLLNALLRAQLLPDNIGQEHRPLITARHRDRPRVEALYPGGHRKELAPGDDPALLAGAERVMIWSDAPQIEGYELIELPLTTADEVTEDDLALMRGADVLIWVTIASQAWRLTEKSILGRFGDALPAHGMIVVSRADKLRNAEDREKLRRRVERETAGLFDGCHFLFGARRTIAASAQSEEDWAHSGAPEILELLRSFSDEIRANDSFRASARNALDAVAEAKLVELSIFREPEPGPRPRRAAGMAQPAPAAPGMDGLELPPFGERAASAEPARPEPDGNAPAQPEAAPSAEAQQPPASAPGAPPEPTLPETMPPTAAGDAVENILADAPDAPDTASIPPAPGAETIRETGAGEPSPAPFVLEAAWRAAAETDPAPSDPAPSDPAPPEPTPPEPALADLAKTGPEDAPSVANAFADLDAPLPLPDPARLDRLREIAGRLPRGAVAGLLTAGNPGLQPGTCTILAGDDKRGQQAGRACRSLLDRLCGAYGVCGLDSAMPEALSLSGRDVEIGIAAQPGLGTLFVLADAGQLNAGLVQNLLTRMRRAADPV